GVVLVGLAVAALPRMPLAGGDAYPRREAGDGDAGLGRPAVDENGDGIAGVGGKPGGGPGSPSPFFSRTCSSGNSARTSLLTRSLSSGGQSCGPWRRRRPCCVGRGSRRRRCHFRRIASVRR